MAIKHSGTFQKRKKSLLKKAKSRKIEETKTLPIKHILNMVYLIVNIYILFWMVFTYFRENIILLSMVTLLSGDSVHLFMHAQLDKTMCNGISKQCRRFYN